MKKGDTKIFENLEQLQLFSVANNKPSKKEFKVENITIYVPVEHLLVTKL
ncbi:hypothetical protein [Tenacibaculum halocynthiae]